MNLLFPLAQEACLPSLKKCIYLTRKLVPDGLIDITRKMSMPFRFIERLSRTHIDFDSIRGAENATLDQGLG